VFFVVYIQPLTTLLAILAEMPHAGSGPIKGHPDSNLANLSAVILPSAPL
jgi:hypothetical protein